MKTSKPKLTILVVTVSVRNDEFIGLMSRLLPQVEKYGGDIQVLAYWDNFELFLGSARQRLVEAAESEYVCFVDDDDELPDYYCDEIYPLLDGVDYIGWRMQLYNDGVKQKPTFHSLKYDKWSEDGEGWYRNVSHLNPIKRKLALKGSFEKSVPEDVSWAEQVAPYVKTEHYIDKPMYFYHHSIEGSLWNNRKRPLPYPFRPIIEYPHFRYLEVDHGLTA